VRKLLVLLLVFGLVSLGSLGCKKKDKDKKSDTTKASSTNGGDTAKDTTKKTKTDDDDADNDDGKGKTKPKKDDADADNDDGKGKTKGKTKPKKDDDDDSADGDTAKPAEKSPMVSREGKPAEAVVGNRRKAKVEKEDEPPAGLLTAGSFDDNLQPEPYLAFVRKLGRGNQHVGPMPARFLGHRLVLRVTNRAGRPVGNARVKVAAGGKSVNLITRSDGVAVFLSSWDGVGADRDLNVTVTPPDGSGVVKEKVSRDAHRWGITLPGARAALPQKLDLAIVLDTTGSMGDELKYLKKEIKSIAKAVDRQFPDVDKRYALVVYRDEGQGDEYVTRTFQFTSSLGQFCKHLQAQTADGGGDYPEAMHRGLEEAIQLHWRGGNTARVMFLIADAPCHLQFAGRTMKALDVLRKKGIAIYPVAGSGFDEACEFIMRTAALLTGSQYIFLTNDSGVGDSHAEPHIPYYQVQKLNQMMIRMIAGELSGRRINPKPHEVLRTVGRPLNTSGRK
jgi:hypothetical protein